MYRTSGFSHLPCVRLSGWILTIATCEVTEAQRSYDLPRVADQRSYDWPRVAEARLERGSLC